MTVLEHFFSFQHVFWDKFVIRTYEPRSLPQPHGPRCRGADLRNPFLPSSFWRLCPKHIQPVFNNQWSGWRENTIRKPCFLPHEISWSMNPCKKHVQLIGFQIWSVCSRHQCDVFSAVALKRMVPDGICVISKPTVENQKPYLEHRICLNFTSLRVAYVGTTWFVVVQWIAGKKLFWGPIETTKNTPKWVMV